MPDVPKSSKNPHLGNDYADLQAVLTTMRPVWAKHGLSLLQAPGPIGLDGRKMSMRAFIVHTSGQIMGPFDSELPSPGQVKKDGTEMPPTPQTGGSGIAYLRRYQAQTIAGMAATDDDGNESSSVGVKEPDVTQGQVTAFIEEVNKMEPGEGQVEALEARKAYLQTLNDADAVAAYLAKRKELKKWKPAAK